MRKHASFATHPTAAPTIPAVTIGLDLSDKTAHWCAVDQAGNENTNASTSTPANCSGVVTVAATGIGGGRASYSNYGAVVTLTAPGGDTGNEWNVVMATAILAMIPPAMVVILMQKWFVKGLVDTEK